MRRPASRASTSPSPARRSTPRPRSSRRSTSRTSRRARPSHQTSANDGWIAMVQHYFASAWLIAAGRAREFVHQQGRRQPVCGGDDGASWASSRPARRKTHEAHAVRRPAGREEARGAGARASTWSRTTAGSPSWPSRCSGCSTSCTSCCSNWGWSIVALVVLLKIAFYWLNASAYRSMAKMKAINPKVMEMRERLRTSRSRCSRR